MKKLNLDYLIDLVDVNIEGCQIPSFNVVKGDWIYLSGDRSMSNYLYQILTIQKEVSGKKADFDGLDLLNLKRSDVINVRRKISSLEYELSSGLSESTILNHMQSLGVETSAKSKIQLLDIKEDFSFDNESSLDWNLLKSISTIPQILFIDFSFDHMPIELTQPIIQKLNNYVNKSGLAVIFCTNNETIKKQFVSRSYTIIGNEIIES